VWNEIFVLGQEEEGIHFTLHRGVRNVETLFGDRSELPVANCLTWFQGSLHVGFDIGHLRSAKATGATSLYSWFSPVMPQTNA
jgi:hypothetical protein